MYADSYDDAAVGFLMILYLVMFAITIIAIIAEWKVFKKAGYHGWEILVPFYNYFVLYDIIFGEAMYAFLCLVPVVGQIFFAYSIFKLAKVFGKSDLWGIGMVIFSPIFLIMLGFDSNAYYSGPAKGNMYVFGTYNRSSYGAGGYGAGGYGAGSYGAGGYGAGNYGTGGYGNQGYDYQTYQSNPFQNNGFQAQGQSNQSNGFQAQGQSYQGNQNPFEQQGQSAQSNPFTQQGGNYTNPYGSQQNNSDRGW